MNNLKVFTLDDIRAFKPCDDPAKYLPQDWRGTALDILNLKDCPFEDRLWVLMRNEFVSDKFMRLFAVWCARQVQHLMTDERSLFALDFMDAYCEWRYLLDDPDYVEMWERERTTARYTAQGAARCAAWDATPRTALYAARCAAWDATQGAARCAAWDAAQEAQEQKLCEMLIAGIETGDVVLAAEKVGTNEKV